MISFSLKPDSRGYTYFAIAGFLASGWRIRQIPERGHLLLNRQLVQLVYAGRTEIIRLMIYKVGGSGRGRSGERRIEITSTYVGGRLQSEAGVIDVLLGYDPETEVFVGFDSRRLHHGGSTENASAFIDVEGLRLGSVNQIVVLPRSSELFGLEYHAFFRAARLGEYIANRSLIHAGTYSGGGRFSGPFKNGKTTISAQAGENVSRGKAVILEEPTGVSRLREPNKRDLESVENGQMERLRSRKITPEQFDVILRAMTRNGALGEFIAMEYERKRLVRAGRDNLARMVRWMSKEDVAAGFDIESFEIDGSQRFIEVKATASAARRFVITRNEWLVAQAKGERYWIYLVTNVNSSPQVVPLQNPIRLELEGHLVRDANEWVAQLR
jgi:Domain of unknown function (DUF3883)